MASKRDRLVGRFVNKTKGSAAQGEKFKVVTKGGVRYHDYGGGRLIADKSGPPTALDKPVCTPAPRAAPDDRPPGVRTGTAPRRRRTSGRPSRARRKPTAAGRHDRPASCARS